MPMSLKCTARFRDIVMSSIFLFFASVTQVEAEEYYRLTNNGYWQKVLQEELREPGLDKLLNWVPEEVPRTVSFYFDIDRIL